MPTAVPCRFARWACLVLTAAVLFALSPPGQAGAAEVNKKIVFLAGTPSHGYGAHEHKAGCLLLAECLRENVPQVDAVVCRNGWPEDPGVLDGAAAIVAFCDGNAKHVFAGHLDAVDRMAGHGVGIGCLHYAVELPKDDGGEQLKRWIGGFFEVFWSVNPHWTAEFQHLPNHPVARGVTPFAIEDEWYYHMRFVDKMQGVTPILTAVPPASTLDRPDGSHSNNPYVRAEQGRPQHVMWVYQRPDGGRGFGFTGAHWHWNWANDNFRTVVLNAIVWTAGLDVPPGGVPSKTPTFEQLQANQDYAPDANKRHPFEPQPWIDLLDSWRKP